MARREDYNWLDDPFNDKKDEGKMKGGSKAFVGLGCVVAFGLVIVLLIMFFITLSNLASSY